MVLHFVKSQESRDSAELADPAMTIVPATNNFISSATFITPVYSGGRTPGSDYANFMTVIIQNGQQGKISYVQAYFRTELRIWAISGENTCKIFVFF